MIEFEPEGNLINSLENKSIVSSTNALSEACKKQTILEGRALVCTQKHDLIVDLGCMTGIIPREEGALGISEGTVRDIALLSRVNRSVCFTITGFSEDSSGKKTALLSRKKAQQICMEKYISRLKCGDIIKAKITHMESFGVFLDIGCGIASLMPIDCISVSRINHPRERFTVGMEILAVVKKIENNRITLSQKELLGTWEQNAELFSPEQTVGGIIRSIEPYGIFVELTPNLAGLAECKDGAAVGQEASVFIKSILPERMKIKLVIIDTFKQFTELKKPHYFIDSGHIDSFRYSPLSCERIIETIF